MELLFYQDCYHFSKCIFIEYILFILNSQLNIEVRQGIQVYFNKVSVIIEDVGIQMVAIFITTHQALHFLHYVHLLILELNSPNGNVFYSDIANLPSVLFPYEKYIYYVTILILNFPTKTESVCSIYGHHLLRYINKCLQCQSISGGWVEIKVFTKK